MKYKIVILHIILFFLLGNTSLKGQQAQELFGRNRIQYQKFSWNSIVTDNFEVYFYAPNNDLARLVAAMGEQEFRTLSIKLGFYKYDKMKIVIYESVQDMLQSNIGIADQEMMIGGQTQLVKSKIEVAYKGSLALLMDDLKKSLSKAMINNIIYGGSVTDVLKSSYLVHLPPWFIDGAAAYVSKGWSVEMDNEIRIILQSSNLRNPSYYQGDQALFIGQSFWNFIELEYGKDHMANIISLSRIYRSVEQSLEAVLGIRYGDLVDKWRLFYKGINNEIETSLTSFSLNDALIKTHKNEKIVTFKLNPSGTLLAYSVINQGRFYVKVKNLQTKKISLVFKKGYKRVDQTYDEFMPTLAWQNDQTLTAIYPHKNFNILYFKNFISKDVIKNKFVTVRHVRSMDWSDDGRLLVMSADLNGKSDIFLYRNGIVSNLTNDLWEDANPVFVGNDILFASDRWKDTISLENNPFETESKLHLYLYNVSNKKVVRELTKESNSICPAPLKNNKYLYISNMTGIKNIYKYSYADDKSSLLLNAASNIEMIDVPKNDTVVYFSTKIKDKYIISRMPINSLKEIKEPVYTERQKSKTLHWKTKDTINFIYKSTDKEIVEETKEFDLFVFESEEKKDSVGNPLEISKNSNKKASEKFILDIAYKGPYDYQKPFGAEKIISTLMVDPLRGLGTLLDASLADVLGNYRINAGAFIAFDFKSNALYGEYRLLKSRVDYKFRYDRSVLNAFNEIATHKYIMNKVSTTMALPLSCYHRISVTPQYIHTNYRDMSLFYITQKDQIRAYLGMNYQYTFDNTIVTGMNMIKGTKAKVVFANVLNADKTNSFNLLTLDYRKYIPIHKEIIFASRFSAGSYFGNSPKNFLLGGMDNWFLSNREFYSFADNYSYNPLNIDLGVNNSDLLFVNYVTNLRGFNYNKQFGNKFALGNFELRIPIVQYLYNGSIPSPFLRNIQLVGFYDVGIAYNGKSPFDQSNSQNTYFVNGSPYSARVTKYISPLLEGFGGGLRTMVFGYYVKTDIAWGRKNGNFEKPILYITFGYDF